MEPAMSNHEVGYGKPPKATRFKKGTSGNSKGRPKGSKNVGGLVGEQFLKPVTVTTNGKKIKMPLIAVIVAQLLKKAAEGDLGATKTALDYFNKFVSSKDSSSVADLMAGRSPFDMSAEDMADISKTNLLKGVT
jgi:hypothetical protein